MQTVAARKPRPTLRQFVMRRRAATRAALAGVVPTRVRRLIERLHTGSPSAISALPDEIVDLTDGTRVCAFTEQREKKTVEYTIRYASESDMVRALRTRLAGPKKLRHLALVSAVSIDTWRPAHLRTGSFVDALEEQDADALAVQAAREQALSAPAREGVVSRSDWSIESGYAERPAALDALRRYGDVAGMTKLPVVWFDDLQPRVAPPKSVTPTLPVYRAGRS